MKARHIYIIGMAALTLTGCVKDELFDTPHPGKGSITVTADWSARGEGIAIPQSWNLSMGDYHGTETAATHAPDHLFEPGSYSLVAWNPATDISVSGTTASVTSTADGCISGELGWLFTSVQDVTIEADRDHAFTAAMQQQVRQLTLTIRLTGDASDRVEGISCSLSGVAGTMDFASDTYGAPSGVALNFTKITQGENAGAWTATVRLLYDGLCIGHLQRTVRRCVAFHENHPRRECRGMDGYGLPVGHHGREPTAHGHHHLCRRQSPIHPRRERHDSPACRLQRQQDRPAQPRLRLGDTDASRRDSHHHRLGVAGRGKCGHQVIITKF